MALCDINLISKLNDGKQWQTQWVENGKTAGKRGQRHAMLKMPLGKTGQRTFQFRPGQ